RRGRPARGCDGAGARRVGDEGGGRGEVRAEVAAPLPRSRIRDYLPRLGARVLRSRRPRDGGRTMSARIVAASLAVALLGTEAPGQQLVATDQGQVKNRLLGSALASGPDLDGDGIGEMAAGGPGNFFGPIGTVHVLKGSDFSKIVTLLGAANESLGASVAWCGDLEDR